MINDSSLQQQQESAPPQQRQQEKQPNQVCHYDSLWLYDCILYVYILLKTGYTGFSFR